MTPSRKLLQWLNVFGTTAALLVIFGYFSLRAPHNFPTKGNVETLARQTTTVAVAAMGMTLIVIAGGIDLSVGSIVAMVTVVIALLLRHGHPPWLAAALGIGCGALCGLINGSLVVALRVVPFIVTLGTLGIYRGAAKLLADQSRVSPGSRALSSLMSPVKPEAAWMLFPPAVWIMFLLTAATAVLLRYTAFGRHVVAIGSNEATARLCGVRVGRVKILVYLLGGLMAGVAGLMQYSYLTVGDPTTAVGMELNVIAAVVIGGASLSGGEGSALGSLVGAAIMITIGAGASQLRWENPWQEIITGMIIVVAVALDRLRHRRAVASEN
jgi:ribose/xylose/arabinose/galactoside ABC-type transport system permease subunit